MKERTVNDCRNGTSTSLHRWHCSIPGPDPVPAALAQNQYHQHEHQHHRHHKNHHHPHHNNHRQLQYHHHHHRPYQHHDHHRHQHQHHDHHHAIIICKDSPVQNSRRCAPRVRAAVPCARRSLASCGGTRNGGKGFRV